MGTSLELFRDFNGDIAVDFALAGEPFIGARRHGLEKVPFVILHGAEGGSSLDNADHASSAGAVAAAKKDRGVMLFAHINHRVAIDNIDGFFVGCNGYLWQKCCLQTACIVSGRDSRIF
jgi:hypothetical protein